MKEISNVYHLSGQNLKVMLSSDRGLPIFTVIDVNATVRKGKRTMTMAKILTIRVNTIRQRPKSTIVGLVDFPETVMYCFRPTTKVEMKRTKLATSIRNTANVVASIRPSCVPIKVISTILVVIV